MKKNSLMRYIDSCVSNIARKIQDEFDESKHPRDEVGKFTTKGGEGAGGSTNEASAESPAEVSKRLNWTQHGETLSDDVMFYKTDDGWTFESDYLADEYVDKSFDSIEQAQKYYKKVMSQQTGASSLRNKELDDIDTGSSEEQGEAPKETTPEVAKEKSAVEIDPETEDNIRSSFEYDLAAIENDAESEEEYIENAIQHLDWTLEDTADTDERAMSNYGADAKTVAAVVNKMIEEFKSKKSEGPDMGYEEQEQEQERSPETDEKIKNEFEEGLDVVKQDADSNEEYRQKADEYLSWALDATAKTDEQAMENYGVSSKVVADIVNKLRENLGSSSHYTETPEDKGKKQLESALKGWWTRADEMVEDLKDAGYEDVDYVNDELMYVSKDGVDYKVSLDKAGRTITAKRVEIV